MEKEVELMKREVENGNRRLEELTHERDVLQRLKTQAQNATKQQVRNSDRQIAPHRASYPHAAT